MTKAKRSGEHAAVLEAYRAKLDSITETTLPLAKELNERIERARKNNAAGTGSHKPLRDAPEEPEEKHDPRRESEDADPTITIDIVDLDELE